MRVSAAARRGLGLTAAAGLVAAGMQIGLASGASAAQDVTLERVGYTCKATNSIVDASLQGPQQFYVTAETSLPDSVAGGDEIPATATTLTLFLPVKLVDRLTGPMEVERVKGSATSDVLIQGVAPGGEVVEELTPEVKDLAVAEWVTLTPGKEVPIVAKGTVEPITVPDIPDGNGLVYVQMPESFVLHSQMDPPVLGSIEEADLNCVRDKDTRDARVIGTIPVGDGCDESECPLPGASGGGTGGGDDGGDGSGGGNGEDPPVINPNDDDVAGNSADNGDGGSGGGDDSGSGGGSGVSPYTTTSLPETGSPIGGGLLALLGAAAAARLALAVRARRRVKA